MSPPLLLLLLVQLVLGPVVAAAAAAAASKGVRLGPQSSKPYCRNYGGCYPPPHPHRDYPYLPAPPGKTPRCAKPGATFCETADNYPTHLVQYLIDRWAFDFNTLLKSEGPEDFNFLYPVTYGTPYGPPSNALRDPANGTTAGPAGGPGYVPAQSYGPPGYQAGQPNGYQDQHQEGYPDRRYRLDVSQTSITYPPPSSSGPYSGSGSGPGPDSELLQGRQPVSINPTGPAEWARIRRDAAKRRTKRQSSDAGATTLCPTTSSFVAPQAALNTQGNWMFVANVPDQAGQPGGQQRYTQFVRAETCISSECNGLCSLPNGYTSRCEQQHVQKRLLALGAAGDRLYTDTFWFPHCCICQITAQGQGQG